MKSILFMGFLNLPRGVEARIDPSRLRTTLLVRADSIKLVLLSGRKRWKTVQWSVGIRHKDAGEGWGGKKMEGEEFEISFPEAVIKGKVLYPGENGPVPLVILCHGIPSGTPVPGDPGYEALARRFLEKGIAACIFNFRGTGESTGNFSLPGWMEDLSGVVKAARGGEGAFRGCDARRLALMGFSGGGAVSIICAARNPGIRALVSVSSPADFTRLITREGIGEFIAHARRIGIIRDHDYPPSEEEYYRGIYECRPVEEVSRVSPTPLLIVHGDRDDTVPVDEAGLLYDAAREPKELLIVPGGGHKLRHDPAVMDKAVGWLSERL